MNVPMAGGGYFRLMPYPVFRWGVRRINHEDQQPAIFMVHAWEVDPDQPAIAGTRLNIWRHRHNLHRTEARLERLLEDFRFAPVREVMELSGKVVKATKMELVGPSALYARVD